MERAVLTGDAGPMRLGETADVMALMTALRRSGGCNTPARCDEQRGWKQTLQPLFDAASLSCGGREQMLWAMAVSCSSVTAL